MKDVFKDKLTQLAGDQFMLDAIKVLVFDRVAKMQPLIDKTNDDRILGQKYRAVKQAEELFEGVLEDISAYREQRSKNITINKGK